MHHVPSRPSRRLIMKSSSARRVYRKPGIYDIHNAAKAVQYKFPWTESPQIPNQNNANTPAPTAIARGTTFEPSFPTPLSEVAGGGAVALGIVADAVSDAPEGAEEPPAEDAGVLAAGALEPLNGPPPSTVMGATVSVSVLVRVREPSTMTASQFATAPSIWHVSWPLARPPGRS